MAKNTAVGTRSESTGLNADSQGTGYVALGEWQCDKHHFPDLQNKDTNRRDWWNSK